MMATATIAAAAEGILAINLGKNKAVGCKYHAAGVWDGSDFG